MKFYNCYDNKPPKVVADLDNETTFISQSEVKVSGLKYQLERYGMDSLAARMEQMRNKFGYADCTKCNDFAQLQNKYREGVEYFESLPSEVRRKFNDLPENFYEFIQKDPKMAYEHGFISKEQLELYSKPDIKSDVINDKNLITDDTTDIKEPIGANE